ncbi:thioredoxin family protein [Psychroserpens ponticola]|uniref:Thioredoxin family protein n=1 Tax=Psychroserpens ponticola TaxID=2932268 RepID=A0ABY7S150_9FLAO|nr:thioredoxin family protein [Psychroserpens ponticola]WCO02646.1 thioredoxin family protein [Psychroserpens ponticola]
MALTPSNMLPLGTIAPEFNLINTIDDSMVSLSEAKGLHGTVIMFICNHCPFVKHINSELSQLAKDYITKGINCIAIFSNDAVNYPEDAPSKMKMNALEQGFIFPYLYDENQDVAKAYDAACTPDFYVFDTDLKLVYRGQLDSSRPGNGIPVTGEDLRLAIDNMLNKTIQITNQKPSIGCNIKWK